MDADFLLPGGAQSFLLRPLMEGMKPTHVVESNRLYSNSTDLNGNLI